MSDHHSVSCDSCSNEISLPVIGSNEQLEWFHLSPRRLPGVGLDGQFFEASSPISAEHKDFCSLECLEHYVERLRLEQEARTI
jgi:hypothetical protein